MRKYLKIVGKLLEIALQKDLVYRSDAFFSFISIVVYLITYLLSLKFILAKVPTIGQYGYQEMLVLTVLGQLWWYVQVMFVRKNFQYISKAINNGTLDLFLLKPISLRKFIPFIQFDYRHMVPSILAIGLLVSQINFSIISFWQLIGAVFLFLNGVLISFSITSIFTSLNFWTGKNNSIFDIMLDFPYIASLPVDFFPFLLKYLFIFGVPVIVLVNPTFQLLHGRLDFWLLVQALLVSGGLFIFSEIVWRTGIKNYTSTN